MNYSLESINESFMHKIDKIKHERKTDELVKRITDDDSLVDFASPELGLYMSRKYNHGHPFTVGSSAFFPLVIDNAFFYEFENRIINDHPEMKDRYRWTFNELKYFKKATSNRKYSTAPKYLTEITLPDTWPTVPKRFLINAKNLTKIKLPYNMTKFEDACLSGTGLKEITVPFSVKEIRTYAFHDCKNLKRITFEDENGDLKIDNFAFGKCPRLKSVTLPDGITKLGSYIFSGDTALEELTLPRMMSMFPISDIDHCSALRKMTFSGKTFFISSTESNPGYNVDDITVYLPKKYREYYEKEAQCPFKNRIYY